MLPFDGRKQRLGFKNSHTVLGNVQSSWHCRECRYPIERVVALLMDKHRSSRVVVPVFIALALALSACGAASDSADSKSAKPTDTKSSTAPDKAEPAVEASPAIDVTEAELVTEAIRSGQPVTCTLTHDDFPLTVYIKNEGLFRVDTKTPAGMSHLLYTNRVVHIWVGKAKQGFKISTDAKTPLGSGIKVFTPKEIEAMPGNEGTTCKVYSGSNSIFQLPTGVKFGPLPISPMVPGL